LNRKTVMLTEAVSRSWTLPLDIFG